MNFIKMTISKIEQIFVSKNSIFIQNFAIINYEARNKRNTKQNSNRFR